MDGEGEKRKRKEKKRTKRGDGGACRSPAAARQRPWPYMLAEATECRLVSAEPDSESGEGKAVKNPRVGQEGG